MAHIRERNGRFTARVRKAGMAVTKTFNTLAEAQYWANAIEGSTKPPKAPTEAPVEIVHTPYNVAEILIRYRDEVTPTKKSWRNEMQFINQLLRDAEWVNAPLATVKLQVLKDWVANRLLTVSASSVSRQYDVVKSAVRFASRDWEWSVPTEMFMKVVIKKPPQSEKFRRPTKKTLENVFFAADQAQVKWLRPVIEFALETAMRRSEITRLAWYDVDIEKGVLRVADGKNGYDRTISLSPRAIELLEAQKADSGVLLTEVTHHTVWGITTNQLYMSWKRCKKRAGTDMRFHDFRHEAASRFFEQGFTPIEVAQMTGHKTMSQVMRYSHADLNTIAKKWGQ